MSTVGSGGCVALSEYVFLVGLGLGMMLMPGIRLGLVFVCCNTGRYAFYLDLPACLHEVRFLQIAARSDMKSVTEVRLFSQLLPSESLPYFGYGVRRFQEPDVAERVGIDTAWMSMPPLHPDGASYCVCLMQAVVHKPAALVPCSRRD